MKPPFHGRLTRSKRMYGYKCEYCEGTVKEKLMEREAFRHRKGFVIVENVPVGYVTDAVAGIIIQQYCRESKRSLKR